MDPFTILSFMLMALLYIVPFSFVYIFAKRLERYFCVRSALFVSGFACALLSFVLLVLDSAINPMSIELGSGIYLSDMNLAGAFFSLMAAASFYLLTDEVNRALGMQSERLLIVLPLVAVLFAFYYTLSLGRVEEPLPLSLNFVFSLSSFLFLFMSFYGLSDIYGSLASSYRAMTLAASYLVLWHVFYQTFAFLLYLFPAEISGSVFYHVQSFITVATIILLAIPVWKMTESLKVTVRQDISPFLSSISMLIGGSAITILKRAIDEYNRENGTSINYDPERGLINADDRFMDFAASYFEKYIGPVARRMYSESVSQQGGDTTKAS